MRASAADEPVEILDADGSVAGIVPRSEMRARRLRHRTVFVLVVATDGRLLVHRRSDDKDVWPGRWDLGAGGVVAVGEADEDAARREVAEELGVAPPFLEFVTAGAYRDDHVDEVARVYRTVHDGPFRFADGEIVEVRFLDRRQLDELLAAEPFVPDTLALVPLDEILPP